MHTQYGEPESGPRQQAMSWIKSISYPTPKDFVRILRELQKLSQSQLAERTGIPQATLCAIENSRANLGVERAKVLARA
jgi:DNA-binding XRE family transcriptional regulator